MKLADLIPTQPPEWGGEWNEGYDDACDDMAELIAKAEAAGYRLVLAMPQHPTSEDDAQ